MPYMTVKDAHRYWNMLGAAIQMHAFIQNRRVFLNRLFI